MPTNVVNVDMVLFCMAIALILIPIMANEEVKVSSTMHVQCADGFQKTFDSGQNGMECCQNQ